MADDLDDIFNYCADQKTYERSDSFRPGKGRAIIKKYVFETMNDGPTNVIEFVIESSEKIPVVSKLTGQAVDATPNAPGTTVSQVVILSGAENAKKSKAGNVKKSLCQIMGKNPDEVDKEKFRSTVSQAKAKEQPLMGWVVDYETYQATNKEKTKEYTRVNFKHVKPDAGNSKEEIAARRQKLGG